MTTTSPIRTPDQRLRVFISSTIGELPRNGRRSKTPCVRCDLYRFGSRWARGHRPEELYRAYLDQSDVFVGIYWQSYGWFAPG